MLKSLLLILFSITTFSKEISIGVEPLPPLINEDGTGITIDLLKKIEKISKYKFNIIVMNYKRAKTQLKNSRVDMIAHTPYGVESEEFYSYALELDWLLSTKVDLYSLSKKYTNPDNIAKKSIGIPRGNKEFASIVTGINIEKFYELNEMSLIIKMMQRGRLQAAWFARSSVMEYVRKNKIANMYYKELPKDLNAGIAIKKNANAVVLKKELDRLLNIVSTNEILKEYLFYQKLPAQGIVPLK